MNTDTLSGKVDQLKGQVKQSVGEATGNDKLANSGTFDQVKGNAKEAWGTTKDAASSVATDAKMDAEKRQAQAHVEHEETAHNAREHVVAAAQNLKQFVSGHAENAKQNH